MHVKDGGALYLWYGGTETDAATIVGNTFRDNTALNFISAIAVYDMGLNLANNYFEGNKAGNKYDTMFVPEIEGGGSSCGPGEYGSCTELGPFTDGSYSCDIDVCHICPVGAYRVEGGGATAADCTPCGT